MPLIKMKETILHPKDLDQDQSHGLRFEEGQVYKVSSGDAVYFTSHGWATRVKGDQSPAVPFNTQGATDADAKEWDARPVPEGEGEQLTLDIQDAFTEGSVPEI